MVRIVQCSSQNRTGALVQEGVSRPLPGYSGTAGRTSERNPADGAGTAAPFGEAKGVPGDVQAGRIEAEMDVEQPGEWNGRRVVACDGSDHGRAGVTGGARRRAVRHRERSPARRQASARSWSPGPGDCPARTPAAVAALARTVNSRRRQWHGSGFASRPGPVRRRCRSRRAATTRSACRLLSLLGREPRRQRSGGTPRSGR